MNPVPLKPDTSKEAQVVYHQTKVALMASPLYGKNSLEFWISVYHDYIEEDLMTLDEVCEDMLRDSENLTDCKFTLDEFKVCMIAITRQRGEKYFDYISRCAKIPAAARVKVLDLKENRFNRGNCPDSLKKRYDKALGILTGLGYS